jgi:hypothetical protein
MASTIPGPARDLVRAVTEAVGAATDGTDAATYDTATAHLATQPAGGRVLGDLLRALLEETHPDGFASDDLTLVVGRCYRAAAAWLPPDRIDVTTLLAVLAGALGIHEPGITYDPPPGDNDGWAGESQAGGAGDGGGGGWGPAPAWPDYAWHTPLLVADLLSFAPATLGGYLEDIFAEYAREAREELP